MIGSQEVTVPKLVSGGMVLRGRLEVTVPKFVLGGVAVADISLNKPAIASIVQNLNILQQLGRCKALVTKKCGETRLDGKGIDLTPQKKAQVRM